VRKKPLTEQVMVITGASSGVGRAVARAAGKRGAKVVVAARGQEGLDAAVADVERAGSEALAVPTDVTDQQQNEELVHRTLERFGRVDTFVANAIVTVYAEAEHLDPDELRRSSALAYRGIPLQAAYCSSKAAARTFLESARVELQKHGTGVDVSLVLPGAINTPQFDRDRQKIGKQPQPVPPIYQPEPYADAILHCAENPIRELPVSWGAQKLLWGQKLSPHAGDWVLRRSGWKKQHTGEPKPLGSPDNLFETLPGDPGAHGRFDDQAKSSTLWTQLRLKIPKR
jgi:short-subunit dehydrogenase